jgi:hypothetical protein
MGITDRESADREQVGLWMSGVSGVSRPCA